MFKPSSNFQFAGKLPGLETRHHEGSTGAIPLTSLALGEPARVREITSALASRVQQLASFGLAPGCQVRLRQRHPAVVVEIGHTTLALDFEVANEVLVAIESL